MNDLEYFVYILESESTGKLYIGQTTDPEKRLADHNRGASTYTKNGSPWKCIGLFKFATRNEALTLEKKLKSWKNPMRVKSWIIRQNHSIG